MPLEIKRSNAGGKIRGYRVFNTDTGKYYSKEALSLEDSKKQRTAIILSELGKTQKPKMKNMKAGGMVTNTTGHPPVEGMPHEYGDTIPAILEVGELVVPVEHTPKVVAFLKSKGIKLPNM
jgi:hypothetical protein